MSKRSRPKDRSSSVGRHQPKYTGAGEDLLPVVCEKEVPQGQPDGGARGKRETESGQGAAPRDGGEEVVRSGLRHGADRGFVERAALRNKKRHGCCRLR